MIEEKGSPQSSIILIILSVALFVGCVIAFLGNVLSAGFSLLGAGLLFLTVGIATTAKNKPKARKEANITINFTNDSFAMSANKLNEQEVESIITEVFLSKHNFLQSKLES